MFANADSELILTPIIIAVLLAPGFSKSTTLAILHFFFSTTLAILHFFAFFFPQGEVSKRVWKWSFPYNGG
ncbi:hypothetical protein LTSESEN_1658 [Salmonella enterica subsp. enterica serovar Senftenberg str. A4-543]|uniref:Uncharacterized protein n=5 Tax=Salmonella enterica TaxID=28901 RepID=G5QXX5_SALSE|nr:hypothetical protein LTSESEN_1658 [Salmonella enterica subsp. enterica serovar Senftenberg str. A4-543]